MQQKTTVERVLHYIGRKLRKDADGNEVISKHHAELAAKMAFEGGRQSVVENIPELEWKCEYPYTADETRTPITVFHIFHNDDGFHLTGYGLGLSKMFGTLDEAKRFANEEYKNRIKQVLGL